MLWIIPEEGRRVRPGREIRRSTPYSKKKSEEED
jgi:hypothetical protein